MSNNKKTQRFMSDFFQPPSKLAPVVEEQTASGLASVSSTVSDIDIENLELEVEILDKEKWCDIPTKAITLEIRLRCGAKFYVKKNK